MLPITLKRVRPMWDWPLDWVDKEFDRLAKREMEDEAIGSDVGLYPVDVHEDDEHLMIDAEMPGFTKGEVHVSLANNVLTIHAERKVEEKKGPSHLMERRYTKVARSFSLPTEVQEGGTIDAELKDGVLHLKLQKKLEAKPLRIEVR